VLRFDAGGTDRTVKLDALVRRQVFLIFKETIHNAARHAACAHVDVALDVADHHMALTVADDGRGFETGAAGQGHGLVSMRRRATKLGAELQIASQATRGTVISLRVPL
jgi:signal transduction histidine kinase